MSPFRKRGKQLPNEKTERNRLLYEYHIERPEASYGDLAGLFGISKQRAWKIVQDKLKEVINKQ